MRRAKVAERVGASRPAWVGNLLLMLASLAFALVLIAALEGALRVLGLGEPGPAQSSRLKYQRLELPLLQPARRPDGTGILRTVDARLPFQAVLAEKPTKGLRVVTVGGSATAGLGFSPNVTFARDLERLLTRAHPDRVVEVVNLGIVALASRQVRYVVEDAIAHADPDVVIVYSGNNEFLELHAEKYAALHGSPASRLADSLMQTHLYRLVSGALHGPPETPSLAGHETSHDDLRLTESELIRDIELSPSEVAAVVDDYEENLEAMIAAATGTDVALVLVTVASNTKWRGREDLPADWLDTLVPPGGTAGAARQRLALSRLDEEIEAATPWQRHAWLFKRATIHEALGQLDAARADYRAASDQDPHLRRALSAMAERVRTVGRRLEVPVVDAIATLTARAEGGIVGFDAFYDYVHFTPRGALWLAADLYAALDRRRLLPSHGALAPEAYVREREARLDALRADPLAVDEWMGLGFDLSSLSDRDLWKYDRMVEGLDRRLDADPEDVRALAYRGNAAYFRVDGAAEAARDYRAALEAGGDEPAIRANLQRLLRDRRP